MKKKKYNSTVVTALIIIPFLGIFGTLWHIWNYGIVWQEPVLLLSFWILTGLGITVGYHRLFSHRSFKAHPLVEWALAIFGAAALENNALKWCSDHRRHHKHLDTDEDPYSITKGFFHAHIGWILEDNAKPIEKVKDLEAKPAIQFQYKYYYPLFIVFGIGLPVLIGTLWGRPLGALFWGVFLRLTLVHHFTYFINSLCHYIGKKPYDHKSTSRDSWYMAFLTFGEGFHNYHHKFQWDYRNGIRWFHFDPSKWSIWFLSKLGLAKELKKTDHIQVIKAKSKNVWEQVQSKLEHMPEQVKESYQEKLVDLKNKMSTLDETWQRTENEAKVFIVDKKEKLLSKKIFRKQRQVHHIEYQALLKSLSVILFTLQSGQY